jgi:hypothetical protein
MGTKKTLIIGKDGIKIQTESKQSTTVEQYVGEAEDIFFGNNRLKYDEVRFNIDPEEQKEHDDIEKDLDKIFSPTRTKSTTSSKRRVQKRKSKFDTFVYSGTKYIKVEDMFIRVFPDDFCEKIASSTYYNYQSRLNDES